MYKTATHMCRSQVFLQNILLSTFFLTKQPFNSRWIINIAWVNLLDRSVELQYRTEGGNWWNVWKYFITKHKIFYKRKHQPEKILRILIPVYIIDRESHRRLAAIFFCPKTVTYWVTLTSLMLEIVENRPT